MVGVGRGSRCLGVRLATVTGVGRVVGILVRRFGRIRIVPWILCGVVCRFLGRFIRRWIRRLVCWLLGGVLSWGSAIGSILAIIVGGSLGDLYRGRRFVDLCWFGGLLRWLSV